MKTPRPQFHLVTQVVMTEYIEQDTDNPPGRDPFREQTTVLVEKKESVQGHKVAESIYKVMK